MQAQGTNEVLGGIDGREFNRRQRQIATSYASVDGEHDLASHFVEDEKEALGRPPRTGLDDPK